MPIYDCLNLILNFFHLSFPCFSSTTHYNHVMKINYKNPFGPNIAILLTISLFLYSSVFTAKLSAQSDPHQLSDTWSAVDSLGRALPGFDQVGPPKPDKYVAIFYWTWHGTRHATPGHVNVDQVIRQHPEAKNDYNHPVWQKYLGFNNHWSEPLFGYYRTTDPWISRKHAEMLSDAGVDLVVFDCTNASFTWKESYEVLGQTWMQARKDGVKTPQFAFLCPFGPAPNSLETITKIYNDIYKPGRFKDLWFYWQGKPLIMAYPDNIPEPMRSFFTFRPGQPGYRCGPQRKDDWSWLEVYPQNGYVQYEPGKYEMISVGVAQNATDKLVPAAMNSTDQVYGRSYTKKNGFPNQPDSVLYGLNFQEQWDRAFQINPQLVFVTGWNEWVAGRFENWQGTTNAFPDQFNMEYSRDIEPVKAEISDNYYYQLISNIRKFKGIAPPPHPAAVYHTITIDSDFADWQTVNTGFLDHKGDTIHRSHPGYGELFYTNTTGRNDFTQLKVANDKDYLYLYAQTANQLTPPTDSNWMMILIDIDRNPATGWHGYDYLLNRTRSSSGQSSIEKNIDNQWQWTQTSSAQLAYKNNELELRITKSSLGIKDTDFNFEFKWADNIKSDGDIMDFYISGDVAPSSRFNYIYNFNKD